MSEKSSARVTRSTSGKGQSPDPWDDYAPFYDWENARTMGRRDIAFWRRVARKERGPVLELGSGTGRLLLPLARVTASLYGIDRAAAMLSRGARRLRRLPPHVRPRLVRGDIRALPFPDASFGLVVAGYGVLQSLTSDRDLVATLRDAARILRSGGLLGIDLVPDLVSWAEYERKVSLRGRDDENRYVTLVETVRQDRVKKLTIFDEEFVVRRGRRTDRRRFSLIFRTVSMRVMEARLQRAGFEVDAVLGGYDGAPLSAGADTWLILARRISANPLRANILGPST